MWRGDAYRNIAAVEVLKDHYPAGGKDFSFERPEWAKFSYARRWIGPAQYYATPVEKVARPSRLWTTAYADFPFFAIKPRSIA